MKNTKHTENLDNSTPQEITSHSKRKILTSIGVSSGIIGASALSQQWTKPVVNSIILPAHAQTTDMPDDDGDGDGMGDDTTTTTTPEMDAMGPAIVLSPMALGVRDLTGDAADSRTIQVGVRLTKEPTGVVTVSGAGVTWPDDVDDDGTDAASTVFTTTNWNQDQVADVVLMQVTPLNMGAEDEAEVTFTASGGGYAGVTADLTYTGGYFTNDVPTIDSATAGDGTVAIVWAKPATNSAIDRYIVQAAPGSTAPTATTDTLDDSDGPIYVMNVSAESTSHTFTGVTPGAVYSCSVTAVYEEDDTNSSGIYRGSAGETTEALVT